MEHTSRYGRITWINCAKCVAILAVLVDHTYQRLYDNQDISKLSYFSVSMFILLAGMTTYMSIENHPMGWMKNFFRLSKKILSAYCLSVVVFYIVIYHSFDLENYIRFLFSFNITLPHYFVFRYLQLMIVSKGLWCIVKYCRGRWAILFECIIFIIIAAVSLLTTKYTNVLNIYGGGGKLFGGTYLILFYIGMFIMKHYSLLRKVFYKQEQALSARRKKLWILSGISLILVAAWWRYECIDNFCIDSKLLLGDGINPPGIILTIMALFVLIVSYGMFTLLEQYKWTKNISVFVSWLGGYSMYIFLYHRVFDDYFLNQILFNNIWAKRFVYFSVMIGCPILIGFVVKIIRNWCKKVAAYGNSQILLRNQNIT